MYILGISGLQRNAAAALFKDGVPVSAIEEEKLVRNMALNIGQSGDLPYQAINYCLSSAGIGIEDIDYIAYDCKPRRILRRQQSFSSHFVEPYSDPDDYRSASLNEFHDRMNAIQKIRHLVSRNTRSMMVDHQLAHAAGAFYLSGLDRAAVLILSGKGDYISLAIGTGEGKRLRIHTRIDFPQSLGWLYRQVNGYLGFQAGGEHQTQWLSTTGEPEFIDAFRNMIQLDKAGMPLIDLSYFDLTYQRRDCFSEKFYREFGGLLRRKDHSSTNGLHKYRTDLEHGDMMDRPAANDSLQVYRRNIARSLQKRLEEAVLHIAEKVRDEMKVDSLCLGGGVASNGLLMSRLEQESGFRRIYTPPGAGNAGNCLGAGLYLFHNQLGLGRPEPLEHVFIGPEYPDTAVKPVFDNCKLQYRYISTEERLTDEVVDLLVDGSIVAWFQGRAEFGPRSLGARSILANPKLDYINENLNVYLKHRDAWRPFAVSVPEERAADFFDDLSPMNRFLLTVSRIKKDKQDLIPAAWFSDGLARVHAVSRKNNPLYWLLLTKFGSKTGVPILINTSFNLFGEPIVCNPRDAVRSFYCSGIDALVINRFLILK